ncbi:hypothetical protein DEU56DRAFT_977193 [Suillus clintonianus]|uniref:uncharacterized protein n=1 Tax=Suillus clintonianus TaxID=1904413 RepID=UPI001B88475A|nr:uncharacterized protein DEU56DRAFT_977193 [Suillus clintonianus]KAG2152802.1 hypothetical protein DEU56DRAFT_977193 [Suillus clintonianus]
MKKLFGRDRVKQQKVTWHSDVSDVLIDDDAVLLVPVRPKRPTQGHRDWDITLSEPPAPSSPPQFAVPPISPNRLASIPPVILLAEKKSFWDGISRDRDRDKDKERGRDKEREIREKEKEREKDKEGRDRLWREEDNPSELTRMIVYLTATSLEDWVLVLEVSDRASATEANAKEAMKALRREFKYAEPKSQLSAARLWAIMLRNASGIFLTQISSRKFIDTVEDVLTSSRTSPVVRKRLMEVLAAAAFITASRPHPSPFLLNDRDHDWDGFCALWIRLKPADKPDVGIPFDIEDAMFSPPIGSTRPPIEEPPSRSLRQRGVIPPEDDIKRLFQECKIAKGNATVLSEMLAYAKPEQIEGSQILEYLTKCRGSQELIYTQIPWASAGAERSRSDRERNAEGNERTKSQPDVQFSSPPSRDYHGIEGKFYNADGEEQTLEEQLLAALLDANEALFGALRIYDDVMRVAEERVAVEISRRDVKMDRRHMENEYLGESQHDYGGGSSRTPSPIPSPPASPSQHNLPSSQVYTLPRVPATISPAHSHYSPPPPYDLPRQHDLPRVVPSQTHPLPRVPPALSPAHSHYGPPPPYVSTSTLLMPPPVPRSPANLPHPPSPPPLPPLASTSLIRPSAKVVEEVDDEEHEPSDLYCEPRHESVVLDSDEEVHGEVNANTWWLRRQPIQYVYDAVAERTTQYLRERSRPPDIFGVSFALDAVDATSIPTVVPTHLPMEWEPPSPIQPSEKALGKRRVVEEVDDEHHDSSDLYYEPRRESVALDSDEETHGGDHANALWARRQPIHYVYDAFAERTAQYLRERSRPPDIFGVSFALDAVDATSIPTVVPTHLPMEWEPPSPIRPSEKALGKRRVVEEVDDEHHDSSDLYYEPRRESVALDSDEETHGGDHANALWARRQSIHYVYDAFAERMAQYLRERRRPPDISGVSFALDVAGATSTLDIVPTHLPMEEEIPGSKPGATIASSDLDRAIDRVTDPYWAGMDLDFSTDTVFAYSSKVNLEKMAWEDARLDAQKVIILNPSSYLGYQLKHAALHGAHRYDEAIETFDIMLSKLDNAPEMQLRELRQQYFSLSEADDAIRQAIHAQLDDAPLRLLDTTSGLLCDREAQICAFKLSTEYKGLLSLIIKHADIRMERIKEVVAFYFRCVMLSHRWEGKEPLLQDIKDKVVYKLNPVNGIVKLQSFCKTARDTGYRWAWIDTCCIDQNNNVELQKSLNSMFIWYRHSALTIVYLSDVVPSSKSGALARSAWNTRGWTLPEFLAPEIVLFYQRDWSLYLDDHSHNHKESFIIMGELEDATGIDAHTLVTFRPGMTGAREKLRWASTRVTTVQEDVAYSLFGVFGIHLPAIYGEKKQNALGRLLQEIVAQSGDITALDWVGTSSEFNSCLPADITSYTALPSTLPPLSEDYIQSSVSWLQNTVDIDAALKLYSLLDNLGAPRFANRRLRLPCIAFTVTEVRRSRAQDQEACFAYEVKASGLRDLLFTTEDKLVQFSRAKPTLQTFLLVRPWDPYLLELPEFADNPQNMDNWSVRGSMVHDTFSMFSGETGPIDFQSKPRALRLIVRLGQPFGAFLLARQRGGEYRRIASDRNIIAQVKDVAGSIHRMHVRTLEIS